MAVKVTADDADAGHAVRRRPGRHRRLGCLLDRSSTPARCPTARSPTWWSPPTPPATARAAVSRTNIKDTVAPDTPTVAISPKPINKANQDAITVSGTASGTSVSITLSDGTTTIAPFVVAVSGGSYSRSFNTTALDDGTDHGLGHSEGRRRQPGPGRHRQRRQGHCGVPNAPDRRRRPDSTSPAAPFRSPARPSRQHRHRRRERQRSSTAEDRHLVGRGRPRTALVADGRGLRPPGRPAHACRSRPPTRWATSARRDLPAPTTTKDTVTPEQPGHADGDPVAVHAVQHHLHDGRYDECRRSVLGAHRGHHGGRLRPRHPGPHREEPRGHRRAPRR